MRPPRYALVAGALTGLVVGLLGGLFDAPRPMVYLASVSLAGAVGLLLAIWHLDNHHPD